MAGRDVLHDLRQQDLAFGNHRLLSLTALLQFVLGIFASLGKFCGQRIVLRAHLVILGLQVPGFSGFLAHLPFFLPE